MLAAGQLAFGSNWFSLVVVSWDRTLLRVNRNCITFFWGLLLLNAVCFTPLIKTALFLLPDLLSSTDCALVRRDFACLFVDHWAHWFAALIVYSDWNTLVLLYVSSFIWWFLCLHSSLPLFSLWWPLPSDRLLLGSIIHSQCVLLAALYRRWCTRVRIKNDFAEEVALWQVANKHSRHSRWWRQWPALVLKQHLFTHF